MFGKVNQIIEQHISALERKAAKLDQIERKLYINKLYIGIDEVIVCEDTKETISFKDIKKILKEKGSKNNA